jgi:hypothetical protein
MYIFPIKKKWFEMILSGDKKEEYREIKPFYTSRLEKIIDFSSIVIGFRNGYSNKSPIVYCLCEISIGEGFTKWGAEEGKRYYILHIKKIYEKSRIT